jgi:single-strand DNA-binding protein
MNSLVIAGNIGQDAELRTNQNGKQAARFSVAVSNGSNREPTWFDCSLWGERGAKLAQYLTKGTKVSVQGEVSAREYNGKAYLQVFVRELTLLGGGEKRSEAGGVPNARNSQGGYGGNDMDDEIPF